MVNRSLKRPLTTPYFLGVVALGGYLNSLGFKSHWCNEEHHHFYIFINLHVLLFLGRGTAYNTFYLSNEKKGPWLFMVYLGD